jgi:sulfofructose kinase
VGTRHVVRSTAHPTTTAVLLVERGSGERRFIIPDRRALERSSPDVSLRAIRRASILLVDGHYARQAAAAIARARELGAAVVADLSDARPAYLKLLRGVDFPILPLEFAASWGLGSARATLRALHERFGGTPVLTLGAKGALAWVDGRVLRVPPHPVRVRDSTGAGDAFHGAFAAGLAHELGIEASLRLAARAGAEACRALGASASLLSKLPARLPTPLPKRLPKSSS